MIPSCSASVSRAAEQVFDCFLICFDNSYRHLPAQVTFLCWKSYFTERCNMLFTKLDFTPQMHMS